MRLAIFMFALFIKKSYKNTLMAIFVIKLYPQGILENNIICMMAHVWILSAV